MFNGFPERQEPRVRRVAGAVNAAEENRLFVGHFNGITEVLRGDTEVQDVVCSGNFYLTVDDEGFQAFLNGLLA